MLTQGTGFAAKKRLHVCSCYKRLVCKWVLAPMPFMQSDPMTRNGLHDLTIDAQ